MNEKILNGEKIGFDTFSNGVPGFIIDENEEYIRDINTIPKDSIKRFIFSYIDWEIKKIKICKNCNIIYYIIYIIQYKPYNLMNQIKYYIITNDN